MPMPVITQAEYDALPKDYLGEVDGHPYAVYQDESGATVYGPVCIRDREGLRFGPYTKEEIEEERVAVGDMGLLYGYVYQPQRFTDPDKPISGTSTFYEWDGVQGNVPEQMPASPRRDLAVLLLKAMGYYGQVLRYCRDRFGQKTRITAGVTDIVNNSAKTAHMTFFGNADDLQLYPREEVVR